MRALVFAIVVVAACSKKEPPSITSAPEPQRKPSWLDAFKAPVLVTLHAPSGTDDKAYAALFDRYRQVNKAITYRRIDDANIKFVIAHGSRAVVLDAEDGVDLAEAKGTTYLLARTLHELDGTVQRIGYLTGKEQSGADLAGYLKKHYPHYALEAVDTSDGDKPIPRELAALIVTTPMHHVPRKELRRIDEFLMHGKPVALLANNLELEPTHPELKFRTDETGMTALLEGYGVRLRESVVIDMKLHLLPTNAAGKTRQEYGMVFVAKREAGRFDPRSPVFIGMSSVVVPFPNEITIDARAKHQPKIMLKTGADILTLTGEWIWGKPHKDYYGIGAKSAKPEKREATLAIAFDGPIGSAFPEPGDGLKDVPKSVDRARLFVLSSAGFLANPFADAGKSPFAGQMPGMDPNLGADEYLMEYAPYYEPSREHTYKLAKQVCDWLLRRDEQIEP